MLSGIFLSSACFILLALVGCGSTRKYDFSRFKNLKPAKETFKIKGEKTEFKWLTNGDPCDYKERDEGERAKATAFCRETSGLACKKKTCACKDSGTEWDSTVQYVLAERLVNGACVAKKGEPCAFFKGRDVEQNALQCVDGLTCSVAKKSKSSRRRRGAEPAGAAIYSEVDEEPQPGICE